MNIIPRSESGLAAPRGKPTGPYPKTVIIIHHTCSGRGLMNPGEERSLMRSWQNSHQAPPYNAWDILQAYSLFQSGRVYENRLWTANSGAIYDDYGWSKKGVGIECDGTFSGSKLMGDLQYSTLVELCADIYQRPGFHAQPGRWIFGHQELPPCRPGDKHSTDCPGNLLRQFVSNLKLQNDVLAYLAGGNKNEEEDSMAYVPFARVSDQGDLHVWVAPEAWSELDKYTADCFLVVKNEGAEAVEALIYTTPGSGEHKLPLAGRDNDKESRKALNLGGLGIKGGFAVTVKSTGADVVPGISIMPTRR